MDFPFKLRSKTPAPMNPSPQSHFGVLVSLDAKAFKAEESSFKEDESMGFENKACSRGRFAKVLPVKGKETSCLGDKSHGEERGGDFVNEDLSNEDSSNEDSSGLFGQGFSRKLDGKTIGSFEDGF